MKNSVTEREVIDALRTSGALAVDDLANNIGAFKHMVFPVLTGLIKQGHVQKKETGNGAPVFELGPKPFEVIKESEDTPAKPAAPKAVEVAKPAVTLLETAKKSATESTQDAPRTAPAKLSVVKAISPAPPTQPASKAVATELNLLAYLALCSRQESAIEEVFGDCEALIGEMADKQLIESLYVIDEYVYSLNPEKAYSLYPELASVEKVEEIVNNLSTQPAQITTPAQPTEAPVVDALAVAQSHGPVPAGANVTGSEPVAEVAHQEPALKEREVVRDEFDQRSEEFNQVGDIMLPSDAMREISRLVHRLVQDELQKEREKMGAGLDVEAVSGKIKKAAVSLREAAKALEETLAILSK